VEMIPPLRPVTLIVPPGTRQSFALDGDSILIAQGGGYGRLYIDALRQSSDSILEYPHVLSPGSSLRFGRPFQNVVFASDIGFVGQVFVGFCAEQLIPVRENGAVRILPPQPTGFFADGLVLLPQNSGTSSAPLNAPTAARPLRWAAMPRQRIGLLVTTAVPIGSISLQFTNTFSGQNTPVRARLVQAVPAGTDYAHIFEMDSDLLGFNFTSVTYSVNVSWGAGAGIVSGPADIAIST